MNTPRPLLRPIIDRIKIPTGFRDRSIERRVIGLVFGVPPNGKNRCISVAEDILQDVREAVF